LIDTAGGVIGITSFDRSRIAAGDTVTLPDGTDGTVVEGYDDENGQEGGVVATAGCRGALEEGVGRHGLPLFRRGTYPCSSRQS
jgi:hypothetical protein